MNAFIEIQRDIQRLLSLTMGANRSPIIITGTDEKTIKRGYCIHFKEITQIESITYDAEPSSDTLELEAFAAGDRIFLKNITSLKLASGAALVYTLG